MCFDKFADFVLDIALCDFLEDELCQWCLKPYKKKQDNLFDPVCWPYQTLGGITMSIYAVRYLS